MRATETKYKHYAIRNAQDGDGRLECVSVALLVLFLSFLRNRSRFVAIS